jgi:hypothetical protein
MAAHGWIQGDRRIGLLSAALNARWVGGFVGQGFEGSQNPYPEAALNLNPLLG